MSSLSRRHFLASGLAATAAVSLSRAAALAPSDEVRVAIIGLGIRGTALIDQFRRVSGVKIVGLSDPDQERIDKHRASLEGKGNPVKGHQDFRRLLDDPDVDAVVIATPNHWHALMGIWACEAGKHVYVEKPASHNVFEGWQLLAAARKHDRIVQTGTQNRSDVGLRKAYDYIHSGKLGDIRLVRGLCYNRRDSIGKVTTEQPVPSHIDYDLWSGPAEMKPVVRKQFHYDWHWDFTYGNGDLGNQGVHELDVCRWFLGTKELAPRVVTAGGRFGYDDNSDTPNTLVTLMDYEPAPLLFELRGLPASAGAGHMDNVRGQRVGVVVECEGGYFAGGRGGGTIHDASGAVVERCPGDGGGAHIANFIEAIRKQDRSGLRAEVEEGVVSAALGHQCNISYQLGEPASAEEVAERLGSDHALHEAYGRMTEHLGRNNVDLAETPLAIGPLLAWDNSQRQFIDSPAANERLTREYRQGYEVREIEGEGSQAHAG